MPQLSFYKIRPSIRGHTVEGFDDVVDLEERADVVDYGPVEGTDFETRLYVSRGHADQPSWAEFVLEGFSRAEIPRIRSVGALLLIRLNIRRKQSFFALPFGTGGRFMLKPGAWERGYGLKTALNLIYEGDDGSETYDVSRLRAVEAKKVGENTIRSRQQANRSTALDSFAFDIRRDLLSRIDGPPRNTDLWGTRVGGADSFHLNRTTTFGSLGRLCRSIQGAFEGRHYQTRFGWVDNTRVVEETDDIEAAIEEQLRADGGPFSLAIPQIIDWERIPLCQSCMRHPRHS